MMVSGWSNGKREKRGSGYGISINEKDRERYFKEEWSSVNIEFSDGNSIDVNIVEGTFWKDCPELRKKEIGEWMIKNNLAPWEKRSPPKLELIPIEDRRFILKSLNK
ncbi:MAG: hypothetical protein K8T10_17295 [Candidatus Eremiobacteraeota bacterium]|nr:hypothetical protein [Candidatus Eremiobacteraeota bacterium]